jgi:NADH dehydrogenase [ubiquinone] 1 alpha subcomplex assembly factor 7
MPSGQADSSLLDRLRDLIVRHGPLPVDEYMRVCLGDPKHGYWQQAATIGKSGDFITAPEISQVFGELIGLWSVMVWEGMGRPSPVRLVELGPGRGTLMNDALRAAQLVPPFLDAATVHLIEISDPLRELQARTLLPPPVHAEHGSAMTWGRAGEGGNHDGSGIPPPLTPPHKGEGNSLPMSWHGALEEVPPGAAIVIANEFLDALPIRQLVNDGDVWRERVVDLAPEGGLRFMSGQAVEFRGGTDAKPGDIVELRAGEDEMLAALAARKEPHMALFVDYGPAGHSFGDTLQAVHRHAYADPLIAPGASDLTAHVHFAALAQKAGDAALTPYGPISQAEFLARLGIVPRAQKLMAANPARAGDIEAGVQRLVSPAGMGGLFKVMAVGSPHLPPPPPFG